MANSRQLQNMRLERNKAKFVNTQIICIQQRTQTITKYLNSIESICAGVQKHDEHGGKVIGTAIRKIS